MEEKKKETEDYEEMPFQQSKEERRQSCREKD
jgi:hypothetical protein